MGTVAAESRGRAGRPAGIVGSLRVGEALVELGHASQDQILEALDEQRRTGERLGEILVSRGVVTRRQLNEALAYSMSVPFVDIGQSPPDTDVVRMVPAWMIRARKVLPLRIAGGMLLLGMCDPRDVEAASEVEAVVRVPVRPCLVDEVEFDRVAASLVDVPGRDVLPGSGKPRVAAALVVEPGRGDTAGPEMVVERVLEVAVRLRATDVHLTPTRTGYSVDLRVDGYLRNVGYLDAESGQRAVARMKVLAGMDVAEKVRPQDGHFDAQVLGRAVDVRVAVVGTPHGESLSARILERRSPLLGLDRLGFTRPQIEVVRASLRSARGMILFCGPVGSGKTTAMFGCLAELEREPMLLVSVEDPVEYTMDRVVQIEVREKAGLTFHSALRSVLRHDPDVVAVGEIRDADTAQLAVNAAMAGRLVLATIHSRTPAGALVRLLDMGVEPYVLASAVDLVVGCALVRTLCPACGGHGRDASCMTCGGSGYFGRTGVMEVMLVSPEVRRAVLSRADAETISSSGVWIPEGGAWAAAAEKVASGITDEAELVRALGARGLGEVAFRAGTWGQDEGR